MSDIEDLIDKLQEATEPDWHLDAAIARLEPIRERIGDCADNEVPRYTSSLDAALTLVPDGWEWLSSNRSPEPHAGRAYIHNREMQFLGGGMARNPRYRGVETTAPTPAIAMCLVGLAVLVGRSGVQ